MTDLSERLEAARREKGLSVAELASAAGTSTRQMSRYLTGRSTPPVDVAARMATALNISLDHLAA